ncbi:DNA-binding transcriptional LysR family regulator [Pseudomonas chlororaphis]
MPGARIATRPLALCRSTTVNQRLISASTASVTCLVLEDQTPTRADVYAVYPQQLHLSARVRSLIDFLVERFKHIDNLDEPGSPPTLP